MNNVYLDELQKRFDGYKLHLKVWAEWSSSGIWELRKPLGSTAWVNVGYEALDLPKDLADDFKEWQEIFDRYGLDWCINQSSQLRKQFQRAFYAEGLELAKRLKAHFKGKAYVEYEGIGYGTNEIRYYYVMSDYNCYLWDEKGYGLSNICLDEDFNAILDMEKLEKLDKEMEDWSLDYFNEIDEHIVLGKEHTKNEQKEREIIERGERLTEKLRYLLPETCVIEYVVR